MDKLKKYWDDVGIEIGVDKYMEKQCSTYLSTIHGFVDDFKDEIGPNDMKHQKYSQKTIKNVISWKHFNNLRGLNCCAVKNPSWIDTQSGYNPGQCKTGKQEIA